MPPTSEELAGETPPARLEFDWTPESIPTDNARLRLALKAAGVQSVGPILDAIGSDVERLLAAHGNPPAQRMAGSLVAVSLNRALRKANAPCVLEPIEGEAAWILRRTDTEPIEWPPWMIPQLIMALVGPVVILGISWLLFAQSAYGWLFVYLALTAGSVVASTKADDRPSLGFRVAMSLVAVGTSAVAVAGLHISGEPEWALTFAGILALLHIAMFGLNAWKSSTFDQQQQHAG